MFYSCKLQKTGFTSVHPILLFPKLISLGPSMPVCCGLLFKELQLQLKTNKMITGPCGNISVRGRRVSYCILDWIIDHQPLLSYAVMARRLVVSSQSPSSHYRIIFQSNPTIFRR